MECKPVAEAQRCYTEKQCTKEEIATLRLALIKIQCASACLQPRNIPDDCDPEKAKLFIEKALEALALARWLEEDWWVRMSEKYSLPKGCFIDFDSLKFYTKKE